MIDEHIKSVEQAKKYFRSMGCSYFHMGREFPERYREYKQLNISEQTETKWRTEQLEEYYTNILKSKDDISLWSVHSNMDELVETLKTDAALKKMLEVTQHICDRVPFKDRVIVSETINGRKYRRFRSGLIYLAYDLNDIPLAKEFAQLSLHFATYEEQKSRNFERCQEAVKLCNDIKLELAL
jgi:hypothetical protein